jgi:hypothetical protein
MDANKWSAIAAACSAVAASVSLVVAWHAQRIQGRSADFANCIEVVERLGTAMRRVRDAPDNHYDFEFTELLNLLEALALLHNERRIAASTKKFTAKFLEEVLGWISIDPAMEAHMRKSMTGDATYRELEKFKNHRKPGIRSLSRFYRNKRDAQL